MSQVSSHLEGLNLANEYFYIFTYKIIFLPIERSLNMNKVEIIQVKLIQAQIQI